MILGIRQLSDTDRIAPKHVGGDIRWTIAGAEDDNSGTGDEPQEVLEIAVVETGMKL
jgi:hypothetical protein